MWLLRMAPAAPAALNTSLDSTLFFASAVYASINLLGGHVLPTKQTKKGV